MKIFIYRAQTKANSFAVNLGDIVLVHPNTDKDTKKDYAFIVRFRTGSPDMLLSTEAGYRLLAILECESETKLKPVIGAEEGKPI